LLTEPIGIATNLSLGRGGWKFEAKGREWSEWGTGYGEGAANPLLTSQGLWCSSVGSDSVVLGRALITNAFWMH